MTKKQIDNLQLVGERVLVKQTIMPKHSSIILPDGKQAPDMYNIESEVLRFGLGAIPLLEAEGLSAGVLEGTKPYFASHMHPEAILDESEIHPKDGGVAYVVVNFRHIIGYDISGRS
jgi:hypothetical protein